MAGEGQDQFHSIRSESPFVVHTVEADQLPVSAAALSEGRVREIVREELARALQGLKETPAPVAP
jgi:hypothetical protein